MKFIFAPHLIHRVSRRAQAAREGGKKHLYIHEAIKAALHKGLAITRQVPGNMWEEAAIVPTNTSDCCFIAHADIEAARRMKLPIGRRWNPLAEDLIADDWVLTDYIKSADLMSVIR